MRVTNPLCVLRILFFCSFLAISICNAEDTTQFEVVGYGECADCKENNLKPSLAYQGLGVTIDCKLKNGDVKRIGAGELDEEGNFKVSVPKEQLTAKGGAECYAQLHSAAQIPCPAHEGLKPHKIELKAQSNDKNTFGPAQNVKFSAALCTSEFLWPHFKYPPLPPKIFHHPWVKKKFLPPLKSFGHPWLHKPIIIPPPIVKPLPPPVPIYKPKPKPKPQPEPKPSPKPEPKPKPKPKPPSVHIHKPKPPVIVKPLPPPIPIYKPPVIVKPLPPPIPIYKPPVIVKPLHPPIPIYKPPIYKKPPCPPIIPKLPPFPKIPPKYLHHPKFGHWPPLPPTIPHP